MMTPNILPYHFRRNLVSYRAGKISVFPQLPTPQLPLHPRKLPKHCPRTFALQPPHHLRNRIARRKRTENVHMVHTDLQLFYGNVMRLSYLSKQLLYSLRQPSLQQPLAILRRPHQVVRRIIGRMRRSSPHHPTILLTPSSWGRHRAYPKIVHSSPPQAVGYPERVS